MMGVRVSIDGKKPRKQSLEKRRKEIAKIEEMKYEADELYRNATLEYKRYLKKIYDENKNLEKPKLILIKCENCHSKINLEYYRNQVYFSNQKVNCFVCKNEFIDPKVLKKNNVMKDK